MGRLYTLSRGGRQLPMSIDHKPGRKDERRRILRSGGYLDESDPRHPRVVRDNHNVSEETRLRNLRIFCPFRGGRRPGWRERGDVLGESVYQIHTQEIG